MRSFRAFLFLPVAFGAVMLSGCGEQKPIPYKVNLEIWGLFDDSDVYRDAISNFRTLNESHIGEIAYRKIVDIETYRQDLLTAFAEGKGPDIFLIRNSWMPDFANLIAPAPAYQTNEKEFRDAFVDVAADDLVLDGKIYGAPLSVDSLGLYYNKDLLNAAGITVPPATWDEFLLDAKLLNSIDAFGNITQSAAALGTAKNINRSPDILVALALQQGVKRETDGFSDKLGVSDGAMPRALDFYSQFARVGSEYYSWNSRQHYSIDAFSEGTLGMMFNYSWQVDALKRKNAKLNFSVASLPQFSGSAPANYANYWTFVVAKNKAPQVREGEQPTFPVERYNDLRVHESWQFLHFLAFPHPGKNVTLRNPLSDMSATFVMPDDPAKAYVEKTKKPAARRDLVAAQKGDPWLAPFSSGNLIAKGWRFPSIEQAESILAEAIESVNRGENTAQGALQVAGNQIDLLGRK